MDFKRAFEERLIRYSVRSVRFAEGVRKNGTLKAVADQYIRSATSVGANVVEAKAASSKKDYAKFFQIALKSANESAYWLVIIERIDPGVAVEAEVLRGEVEEIAKVLGASLVTLRNSLKEK